MELLVREVSQVPRTIQTIVTGLGCPPELDGKAILLRTPHMLGTAHGAIRPILSEIFLPA